MAHAKYDSGYKKNLRNKRHFIHFLKKYINEDWTKNLKPKDLHLCDKEFILQDYKKRATDIFWRVRIKDLDLYIYLIQELQSGIDYTMPFRNLIYVTNCLLEIFLDTDEQVRERKDFKLPTVISIVFYNGSAKWNVPTEFKGYQAGYDLFSNYGLNYKYYLIDLNQVDKEYILSTNTLLDNIFAVDKSRLDDDFLETIALLQKRIQLLSKTDQSEFLTWLEKNFLENNFNQEQVNEIIAKFKGGEKMFTSNISMQFREKQLQDRRAGGLESELSLICKKLTAGLSPESISEWMELDKEYVESIASVWHVHPDYSYKDIAKKLMENERLV